MMRNWFNTFLSSPQDTKALFLSLSLLCLLAGTPLQTRGGLVRAQGMSVELERGGVATLGHGGSILTPLAAPPPRLFTLTISQAGATHGPQQTIASGLAAEFDLRLNPEPDGNEAILTYQGFKEGVRRVVCTIGPAPGARLLRWGISVELHDGWLLENVQYPCITLTPAIGSSNADDILMLGSSKGGLYRSPGNMKAGTQISITQPGQMAAQFGCLYDDRIGFYTAAEDAAGHPKSLAVLRSANGLEFSWQRPCWSSGADEQPYHIVTATFTGADDTPADWRDAADIYKAWALNQEWCRHPFARREDLPAWLKDAPAMVRFGRDWLANPSTIEEWLRKHWKQHFQEMPLLTAYWGWEKRGNWVTPDYFPVHPSDEAFRELVANTRKLGCHAFPWPSGYHWTLTYKKQPDGSFEWDDRQRFDKVARPYAVHNRDGSLYLRTPSWLHGGNTACLCGGDPWTIRWWNEDVCLPLTRLGCELIQIDQVVGAAWPACYATNHGHPNGRGRWMTQAFATQLLTMRDAMRQIEPDAVVCFEEPNDWFNHLVGLQDYRDCEAPREWASAFNYLYHEFLPCFQSNPRRNDLVMAAYCAVNGQMPHMVPSQRDLSTELLVNGGFEPPPGGGNNLRGWDKVSGFQGAVWNGEATGDTTIKHGGASALRLFNARSNDTVQVSQNIAVEAVGFAPGGKYRLSAWLKTGRMARPNSINYALFAPELKNTGTGGRLPFPPTDAGWQRVSSEFTIPAGSQMLRIMIHINGKAEAWVDDVELEALADDGSATPAIASGISMETHFMRNWTTLYHGEGRPWLFAGRMARPPALSCATLEYRDRQAPAVFHNAFVAPDGREAIVLANATTEKQAAILRWRGLRREITLEPFSLELLRE